MRALLGIALQFCQAVVLKSRTVPQVGQHDNAVTALAISIGNTKVDKRNPPTNQLVPRKKMNGTHRVAGGAACIFKLSFMAELVRARDQ